MATSLLPVCHTTLSHEKENCGHDQSKSRRRSRDAYAYERWLMCISLYLPLSPFISIYLPISPCIWWALSLARLSTRARGSLRVRSSEISCAHENDSCAHEKGSCAHEGLSRARDRGSRDRANPPTRPRDTPSRDTSRAWPLGLTWPLG